MKSTLSKKRLLFISQCYPLPLDGGGKIKTFTTLKAIARAYDVRCIFISERKPTILQKAGLKKIGVLKQHTFVNSGPGENIKKHLVKLLINYVFLLRPHYVYQYSCSRAKRFIKQQLINWKPEIVHIDHLNSAQFLPSRLWFFLHKLKYPIVILDNHNVIHNFYYTRLINTQKKLRKLYLLLEGSLNYLYEFTNYRRFDHIFSISSVETRQIKKFNTHVTELPVSYPIRHFMSNEQKTIDLLFVGFLDWPPNEEGVDWFLKKVYPLAVEKVPDLSFAVVGSSSRLNQLTTKYPRVAFLGHLASIDNVMSKSKVFVIPILSGSGLCLKVLTALSVGMPVVSTTMGVRGYAMKSNQDLVVADKPNDFAEAIFRLLKSKSRRALIGHKGKKFFELLTRNAQEKITQQYLEVISKIELSQPFSQTSNPA